MQRMILLTMLGLILAVILLPLVSGSELQMVDIIGDKLVVNDTIPIKDGGHIEVLKSNEIAYYSPKSSYTVTADSDIYSIDGEIFEWGYLDDNKEWGEDYINFDNGLAIVGGYLCDSKDIIVRKGTNPLLDSTTYNTCIYYPEKSENITDSPKEWHIEQQMIMERVSSHTAHVMYKLPYDPVPANLTQNLTMYYSYDVNADDDLGHENQTVVGTTWHSGVGITGSSYYWNGTSAVHYIDDSEWTDFMEDNQDWTINFWAKQDVGGNGWYFSKLDSATQRWVIATSSNEALLATVRDSGSQKGYYSANSVLDEGEWFMFTVTYNQSNTTMTVYFNGTRTTRDSTNYINQNGAIGAVRVGTDSSELYDMSGYIDEIGIWNRMLNATEIIDMYSNYTIGYSPLNTTTEEGGESYFCGCVTGEDMYLNFSAGCYFNNTCDNDGFDFIGWGSGSVTVNASFVGDHLNISSGQVLYVGSNASIVLNG